jgi:hypothetical protein
MPLSQRPDTGTVRLDSTGVMADSRHTGTWVGEGVTGLAGKGGRRGGGGRCRGGLAGGEDEVEEVGARLLGLGLLHLHLLHIRKDGRNGLALQRRAPPRMLIGPSHRRGRHGRDSTEGSLTTACTA